MWRHSQPWAPHFHFLRLPCLPDFSTTTAGSTTLRYNTPVSPPAFSSSRMDWLRPTLLPACAPANLLPRHCLPAATSLHALPACLFSLRRHASSAPEDTTKVGFVHASGFNLWDHPF